MRGADEPTIPKNLGETRGGSTGQSCESGAAHRIQRLKPGAWYAWLHDADDGRSQSLASLLEGLGLTVLGCSSPECALRTLRGSPGAVALLQHPIPATRLMLAYADRAGSLSLRDRSRILLTGASALLDSLAVDFPQQVRAVVERAIRLAEVATRQQARLTAQLAALGLLGDSVVMQRVFSQLARIAPLSDIAVLITGETGTGKELLARALHRLDPKRSSGPFVALNCAAISPELAEAELFGHRRGGFTGADRDRPGLFRAAEGGVLFLDEVAELPPSLQGKLLRALQERRVLPVGDEREVRVNVRVIAATNRDLDTMIADRSFRLDLYHRLRLLMIRLPSLAERREDIPQLVRWFLNRHAGLTPEGPPAVDPEFLEALQSVPLPGNVRELENIVCEALVYSRGRTLGLPDLPGDVLKRLLPAEDEALEEGESADWLAPPRGGMNLSRALEAYERILLSNTLRTAQGNRTRAARILGLTPRSIYNKIRKYGLLRE